MNAKNKKAKIRTEIKDLNREDTIEHYNAVLLEQIDSKMSTVIEVMEATKTELKRDMNNLEKKLTQDNELIKGALRDLAGRQIATDKKVDILTSEMHEVETRLTGKIDKIGEKVDNHEGRIVNLEKVAFAS